MLELKYNSELSSFTSDTTLMSFNSLVLFGLVLYDHDVMSDITHNFGHKYIQFNCITVVNEDLHFSKNISTSHLGSVDSYKWMDP